jgi:putative exporter of polyketide antibiotics
VLRYAFRLHRWGLVGFGLVLFAITYVQAAAFAQLAGSTAASRAVFARSMDVLARQIPYFLPETLRVDTLAGYVQWRSYGPLALVVMIWAIASAAGAARGDEDRQLVDYWLAARVSRARVVATRLAAYGLAALLATAAAGLGTIVGAARSDSIGLGGLAGKSLSLWLLMVGLFALCSLLAQLVASTRAAQVTGAAAVVALYLLNVLARVSHAFDGAAWVSPFHWYDATTVMAPGGRLDAAGVALSVALIVVAGALAALAFARRDVHAGLLSRPVRGRAVRPATPSPLLAWPVARLLYRQRWVLLGWTLGIAVAAVYMVSIAHAVVDATDGLPALRQLLTHGGGDPVQGFVATFWFGVVQLLLAGFAVHLVAGWAADDTEGILASVLGMPVPRWSVIAERAAVALVGTVVVVAAGSLVAVAAAAAGGVSLDAGAVLRASWLLVPYTLTYAAVGAAASADFPRAAVGVLGLLAFLSFLDAELVPLLSWPAWVADLSVQQLYGNPFSGAIFWNGLWAMLAVVVAGFGLATLLMERREVGV